jgi:hypothetical protein
VSKFEEYLETVKNNKPLSKCVTTDNQNVKIYPKDINTFINKKLLQYAKNEEKNELRNTPKEEINSKLKSFNAKNASEAIQCLVNFQNLSKSGEFNTQHIGNLEKYFKNI